jgi:preprotein translocase SecE subunit
MIKFFYDSLETLHKVTFPTKKDYINLTLAIFATVIISGAFFILVDTFLSGAYRAFYTTMRPDAQSQLEQQAILSGLNQALDITGTTVVTGDTSTIEVQTLSGVQITTTGQ